MPSVFYNGTTDLSSVCVYTLLLHGYHTAIEQNLITDMVTSPIEIEQGRH